MNESLASLSDKLSGAFYFRESGIDNAMRKVYSTDASMYQEKPLAVALPEDVDDIKTLIRYANENLITLVPRAAGTSLSGQVVGNGIIVDISKYFNNILEVNVEQKWARVQPGVIRDDLNNHLRQYGLMFGPETSSASRAMIGGMVGNNSCGLHSISWGSTRDHLLETTCLLSDGSEALFKTLSKEEVIGKTPHTNSLEDSIHRSLWLLLSNHKNQELIARRFPRVSISRRNSGYALDSLLNTEPFHFSGKPFNLATLIAGSEGTLCFLTEVKIALMELPPPQNAVLCVHCNSLKEALTANLTALEHKPAASELVDKYILDFTKGNLSQMHNRFFIQGDPAAILMVEFFAQTTEEVSGLAADLAQHLQNQGLGYAWPILYGLDANRAWDVRKGGLGLLRNMRGDQQPVNLIEDCAVDPKDLPDYITDIAAMLERHGVSASYYAHAGAGELHIEPMLNLKTPNGKRLFRQILADTVELLKKYGGSLSGEHGDGRLRGEFIPEIMGEEVYALFKEVKHIFDPHQVFNAGKIVNTPPMDEFLRYSPDWKEPAIPTLFGFKEEHSILRMAEKCSGSGDCRKTHLSGGTMCPSFMATRQEKDTTRARANILRDFLTHSEKANRFDHEEILEVMDLCLSCKGCKSECPSGVDIARMKAEFLQHYYDANGTPFRTRLIGNFTRLNAIAAVMPAVYNFLMTNPVSSGWAKRLMGFSGKRPLPRLYNYTLKSWFTKWKTEHRPPARNRKIFLFADEFTNYNDVPVGIKFIQLMTALGYEVEIPDHLESGRTYLSKGLVRQAKKIAIRNVKLLADAVADGTPLVGLEPSAILTLRDEYPDLVPDELLPKAKLLAKHTFYVDEFLAGEILLEHITGDQFTAETRHVKLHGHCHQKALSAINASIAVLSLPANYKVELIPSGCCGMAGSFGYEAEHYDLSMNIGELVLFPAIRTAADDVMIAAPGTSCRHQIRDGTGRTAHHPVEILWDALIKK
ncbi:MAG: FAD-linked oxidase C-terminal domain-containing protein [Chitinophagaceae bacterium]